MSGGGGIPLLAVFVFRVVRKKDCLGIWRYQTLSPLAERWQAGMPCHLYYFFSSITGIVVFAIIGLLPKKRIYGSLNFRLDHLFALRSLLFCLCRTRPVWPIMWCVDTGKSPQMYGEALLRQEFVPVSGVSEITRPLQLFNSQSIKKF